MGRTLTLWACLFSVALAAAPQAASAKEHKTKTLLRRDGKVVYEGESVKAIGTTKIEIGGSVYSCTEPFLLDVAGATETVLKGAPPCLEGSVELVVWRARGTYYGALHVVDPLIWAYMCEYGAEAPLPVLGSVTIARQSISSTVLLELPWVGGWERELCHAKYPFEVSIAVPGVGA